MIDLEKKPSAVELREQLSAARILVADAHRLVRQLSDDRSEAERIAKHEVAQRFRVSQNEASEAYQAAAKEERRLRDAVALADPHPWTGRKVIRYEDKSTRWNRQARWVPVYGIVEMMTSTTRVPANVGTWRTPEVGMPLVRFLKKDHSPGLKVEVLREMPELYYGKPLDDDQKRQYWALADDTDAKGDTE